jgi:hypothetical protein
MTMGPEPIIRTDLIEEFFGTLFLFFDEMDGGVCRE